MSQHDALYAIQRRIYKLAHALDSDKLTRIASDLDLAIAGLEDADREARMAGQEEGCAYGHTARVVGCVSCVLVFDREIPALGALASPQGQDGAPPSDLHSMVNRVTRLEVIDDNGRQFTRRDTRIGLSFQDDERTLKVFIDGRAADVAALPVSQGSAEHVAEVSKMVNIGSGAEKRTDKEVNDIPARDPITRACDPSVSDAVKTSDVSRTLGTDGQRMAGVVHPTHALEPTASPVPAPPPPDPGLRALVETWRKRADEENAQVEAQRPYGSELYYSNGQAWALRRCADELDSALARPVERLDATHAALLTALAAADQRAATAEAERDAKDEALTAMTAERDEWKRLCWQSPREAKAELADGPSDAAREARRGAQEEGRHDAAEKYLRRALAEAREEVKRLSTLLSEAALAAPQGPALEDRFDFHAHLQRQQEFSARTFGPGPRAAGVVDHIRSELREIEAEPAKLSEWIDVTILALDGAWRAGHSPDDIIAALVAKQMQNEAREWPDWRTADTDKAIEHVRSPASPAPVRSDDPVSQGIAVCACGTTLVCPDIGCDLHKIAAPVRADCAHEWVTHLIQTPHGYGKPGATVCQQCGMHKPLAQFSQPSRPSPPPTARRTRRKD